MEEEVVNKKTEEGKKKKRTSLKSILGWLIIQSVKFLERNPSYAASSWSNTCELYPIAFI